MNLIENAKRIASRAHSGQHRRDGCTPYINHPAAVAERLANESPEVVATAWLHDVLEDSDETALTLLEAGIPAEVVAAVEALTKTEGVTYHDYLAGVKANPIARKVKVADMLANLADSPTEKQIVKYARGLLFLANTLNPAYETATHDVVFQEPAAVNVGPAPSAPGDEDKGVVYPVGTE